MSKIVDNILIGPPNTSPTFMEEINQSLDEYLNKLIKDCPNKISMIDAESRKQVTVAEVAAQSRNLATQLQSLGCGGDTVIGIITENRLEYLTVILGSIYAGTIVTCFNHLYSIAELKHGIGISNPSIIFCSPTTYSKVKEVSKSTASIKHIILFETENVEEESTLTFSSLIKPSDKKLKIIKKDPNDIVAILYSSGTTGYPKGVMLTHRNYVYMLKLYREEKVGNFRGRYCAAFLPLFHCYGLLLCLFTLGALDLTLVMMKQFEENLFLRIMQEYKVEHLFSVPPIVTFLLKSPLVQKYDLSNLKHVVCGGAPLKNDLELECKKKFKLERMWQSYGMTETTMNSVKSPLNTIDIQIGSVGILLNGAQGKIIDVETGIALGPHEHGELLLKGPHIMKGYYKNTEATNNTIDKDGWLHTGDVAYYDENCNIYIVDRLKELIKYKGYQVAPAELEGLLMNYKDVQEAAVIGIPDESAGEIPKAFVKKQPASTVTEQELMDYVAGLVSPQKRLRGGVTFLNEIPKSQSGKILRKELRQNYAKLCSTY